MTTLPDAMDPLAPPNLPPLVRALLVPARHGPDVHEVELLETAISWVLLAGEFAYKIKKPITLSFLDFSTLDQRKHCCEEELRLNRRYAPDLYLAVVSLFNTPEDPQWSGSTEPIEYAVKMRRFSQQGRLDHVCERGALQPAHLSVLARTLAEFHAVAAVVPAGASLGAAACVRAQALQNFDDLRPLVSDPVSQARLQALQAWTEVQHAQLAPLMQQRHQGGRVRECHGDLHLGNLVLMPDHTVRLFDCIEFSDSLRWIDVAGELAFLYMDLLARQQPGLACWFLNEALEHNGDYAGVPLLRFYTVYRALVRAKVDLMQASHSANVQEAAQARLDYLAYLRLAESLAQLQPPPQPQPLRLVITHGVSGCGKTFASNALLQQVTTACTIRLRTDVERKRLCGLQARQHTGAALNQGIYAPGTHAETYAHLATLATGLLQAGWSVVVDGTFLHRADRDHFRALAGRFHADFAILAPQATPAQLRQRVQARSALGQDASDATLEVLEQQLQELEPLAADEPLQTPEGVHGRTLSHR